MRMVRGPTPVFDSQAFLATVGSEKTILKPMRIQHDIDSSDSLFSAQLHAPGSAELVNKASLKYFPLQVHFSLRTLPEGRELVSQVTNSCFWITLRFACTCEVSTILESMPRMV